MTPPTGPVSGAGNSPPAAAAAPAAVHPPSPGELAWAELAKQLTPAASITRIDTATARAVTTVTVIGLLLTGLGALGAGQFAADGTAATDLAVAAALTAALAVACALVAQVLTISRHLNPADLLEVKAWYRRQFSVRAYATQAATVLLIVAALLAGATAATALLTASAGPAAAATHRNGATGLPERPLKRRDELCGGLRSRPGARSDLPEVLVGSVRVVDRFLIPAVATEQHGYVVPGAAGPVHISVYLVMADSALVMAECVDHVTRILVGRADLALADRTGRVIVWRE